MASVPRRDPWRLVWRFTTSDAFLATLLVLLSAGIAVVAGLPQMPASDPVKYARWLSDAHARFGGATEAMRSLGLFTVARSLVFRSLVALLAGCLLLRLVEQVQQSKERRMASIGATPLGEVFAMLQHVGALLLLTGMLLASRWSWRVEGQIVQSGTPAYLPSARGWVTVNGEHQTLLHSPGIIPYVEKRGPGATISAADRLGNPLMLYETTDSDPVALLTVALTEDRYFAVPEAHWIVRLTRASGPILGADDPILVQVYRSPTGVLIAQEAIEGTSQLDVGEATLRIEALPYIQFSATSNPGMWPARFGLALLIAGVLCAAGYSALRPRVPEENSLLSATGDPPSPALNGATES